MIFWIILFALIVLISFLLALRSMADFAQNPAPERYTLYLIRRPQALTESILDAMHGLLRKDSLTISLERLIKGKQSALVIYGPIKIFKSFPALDLVELEDYAEGSLENLQAWQMGVRHKNKFESISYFQGFPPLLPNEQFWWQLILKPQEKEEKYFEGQVRVIVKSERDLWQKRTAGELVKVPKPFSRQQLVDFFKKRTFLQDKFNPTLRSTAALQIVALS